MFYYLETKEDDDDQLLLKEFLKLEFSEKIGLLHSKIRHATDSLSCNTVALQNAKIELETWTKTEKDYRERIVTFRKTEFELIEQTTCKIKENIENIEKEKSLQENILSKIVRG